MYKQIHFQYMAYVEITIIRSAMFFLLPHFFALLIFFNQLFCHCAVCHIAVMLQTSYYVKLTIIVITGPDDTKSLHNNPDAEPNS